VVLGQVSTSPTADDYPRLGLFGKTTPFAFKSSPVSSPVSVDDGWDSRDFIDEDDSPLVEPPIVSRSLALPFLAFFPTTSCALARKKLRHVTFASSPTHSVHCSEFEIEPYSEVYGMHPRDFDFNECGEQVPRDFNELALEDIGYDWQMEVGAYSMLKASTDDCNSGDVFDNGEHSCGLQQWWGPPPMAVDMGGYPVQSQIQVDNSLYSGMHVE
jgi:hypothetical protein